jgi:hypothetical protein
MKAFLSHSSKDKPFVLMLKDDIEASGVAIWIDVVEMLVGDSLIRKISEGIVNSNYVIACLSQSSINSNWVREELEIATTLSINSNRVVILPVLLEDCEIPAFLVTRLHIDFRQAVQYDESFRKLLQRLNPEALPAASHSFYSLTITATRKDRLVEIAKNPSMAEWVLDYLIETVESRGSHKERCWTYYALGEIGGRKAEAAIERGLSDHNDFARSCAENAWKMLGH